MDRSAGARLARDRTALLSDAQLILQVRVSGAGLPHLKPDQVVIGHADPLTRGPDLPALAQAGVVVLAEEQDALKAEYLESHNYRLRARIEGGNTIWSLNSI